MEIRLANEKLGGNSVDVGNAYILKYANRINYAQLRTVDIILQMKLYHFIRWLYTEAFPIQEGHITCLRYGNPKLEFIENGCMPYFYLTMKSPTEMRYTNASDWEALYSSEIDHWFNAAVELYKELDENLSRLWDKTMDKHEIISKGVKKVTYSDGTVIYFNYTDETVEVDGITLDSLSYIVKGGAN